MMPTMPRACVVIAIALGALAVTTPALAAVGKNTNASRQKAFVAYRSCMKAHGVKLPATSFRPGGASGAPRGSGAPGGNDGQNASGASSASGAPGRGFGNGNFVPRNLPKGVTTAQYAAARKACMSKLPTGGFGPQSSTQFQAYLSCLRDHGVTVPTNGGLRALDRNDPTYQAANTICGVLLPTRPGAGAGATTPTSGGAST
jgi:hypothetical protein